MSSHEFKEACKFAATFFTTARAERVRRLVPGNYGLAEAMLYTFIFDQFWHYDTPASISKLTADIFSTEFNDRFTQRAQTFDEFCGLKPDQKSLSKEFIKEFSIAEWVVQIIHVIAGKAETRARIAHETE